MKDLQRFIKTEISQKSLPSVEDIKSKKMDKFSAKLDKVISESKHVDYIEMVKSLTSEEIPIETLAASLLSMQLNKEIKNIPVFEQVVIRNKSESEHKVKSSSRNCKLMLDVGKIQRIAPNFVLGALVEATGLSGKSFGKIEIFDKHTTVEIPESEKENILMAMNNSKINGLKVTAQLIENSTVPGKSDYRNRDSRKSFKPRGDKSAYPRSKKPYRGRS